MEEEWVRKVFRSDLSNMKPPPPRLVKVYVASTYTDMMLEKSVLFHEVYPQLKKYCMDKYGLEFQMVDMRWGVRDEATDDHMTTSIFLQEIENCKLTSLGPNFVLLLGQKYGYRPLPNQIPASLFILIMESIKTLTLEGGQEVVERWYKKDANCLPTTYILQPISSILVNFMNSQVSQLQREDEARWWETIQQLHQVFSKVTEHLLTTKQITKTESLMFKSSVIEKELRKGILEDQTSKEHCLAFVRVIKNINFSDGSKAPHFVDTGKDGIQDRISGEYLNVLRDTLIENTDKRICFRYTPDWVGKQGLSTETHQPYLNILARDFNRGIVKQIERALRTTNQTQQGLLTMELHTHLWKLKQALHWNLPRTTETQALNKYITGDSSSSMVVYGVSGAGKTYLLAHAVDMAKDWMGCESPLILARVLGTCPNSGSVQNLLTSLCKQISYSFDLSYDDIPQEIVPLKTFFKGLLSYSSLSQPIVIFLDAFETLFVDEHNNGASWIPNPLPKYCKVVVSFQQEEKNGKRAKEEQQFITALGAEGENILHLGDIGENFAEAVFTKWMKLTNKRLTNYQWRVVLNATSGGASPLLTKIIFAEFSKWRSYFSKDKTQLTNSLGASIGQLLGSLEEKYDATLVQHSLAYIAASKFGLSESELEDVLSLDDMVLGSIFTYQIPSIRRLPSILWLKVKRELGEFLSEVEADGVRVLTWAHKPLREAVLKRYFKYPKMVNHYYHTLSDFFLGTWCLGRKKPFPYSQMQRQRFNIKESIGEADRRVAPQPLVYMSSDGESVRFNLRKFSEMPHHLVKAQRFEVLFQEALFNYAWLHGKLSAFPLECLLSDFQYALDNLEDEDQAKEVLLVADALKLGGNVLSKFPDNLACQLVGRLLPHTKQHPYIKNLVLQCDLQSPRHNALVPVRHCLLSPGGPMKFSLEGHQFAIFGYSLTSDCRYVISVSNKFLTWDLGSSEICRDMDPHIEGLMLGLAVSQDNRHAAAHTSINQVVLLDVMLGQCRILERPLDMGDEIVGLCFVQHSLIDHSVSEHTLVVYNSHYWRRFNLKGKMLEEEYFNVALPQILEMIFLDIDHYIAIFWSGDEGFNDRRIEILHSQNRTKSDVLKSQQCYCMEVELREVRTVYVTDQSNQDLNCNLVSILKYGLQDGIWTKLGVVSGSAPHLTQLALTADNQNLVGTTNDGFSLWPLGPRGIPCLTRLLLPTEFRNVISRPAGSNSCLLNKEKSFALAGVREYIFIWDLNTETLIKSFKAHYGRIIHIISLTEGHWNSVITSSMDRTIKVWDLGKIAGEVHEIKKQDNRILNILTAQTVGLGISVTRSNVGIWDLTTGELKHKISKAPVGAVITEAIISSDGKTLVVAESDKLYIWNLTNRAVICCVEEKKVEQLIFTNNETRILSVSLMDNQVLVSCRDVATCSLLYQIQTYIKKFRKVCVTPDLHFLVVLAYDNNARKEQLSVYHLDKGIYLFRIQLRYPQLREVFSLVGFDGVHVALVDNEKANVVNVREKKFTRAIQKWSGQLTKDQSYGLGAPARGGLFLVEIRTGRLAATYINPPANEGVFTSKAGFTANEEYVWYYHSGRQTVRLFRLMDATLVANLCIMNEVSCLNSTSWSLLVGCTDGSLSMFAIADPKKKETGELLATLPSRSGQKHTEAGGVANRRPLLRMRAAARVILMLTRRIEREKLNIKKSDNEICSIS